MSRLADLFPYSVEQRPGFSLRMVAVAVVCLLAVMVGLWGFTAYRVTDPYPVPVGTEVASEQVFKTAVGEHSTAMLLDGSQVTLNTNSHMWARFTNQQRRLYLESGEIYVQVAHDPSRPLAVWAAGRLVEAVGTEFNIAITDDKRIEVIVTEGRVLVGVADKEVAKAGKSEMEPGSPIEKPPVVVSAGERIVLDEDKDVVEPIEPDELKVRLSWRGGNLVFRGESLEEALAEIERYTRVEFVVLDEDLKKMRIIGMFKAGDLDGLLTTLRQNFDVAYQRVSDDKVVLIKK